MSDHVITLLSNCAGLQGEDNRRAESAWKDQLSGSHRYVITEKIRKKRKRKLPPTGHKRLVKKKIKSKHPLDYISYGDAIKTHDMWQQYVKTMSKSSPLEEIELTGALIKVIESSSLPDIGKVGICIRETDSTITLLTNNETLVVLRKEASTVKFRVRENCCTLLPAALLLRK